MSEIPLCKDCEHCVYEQVGVPSYAATALHTQKAYRCVAMNGLPNPVNGELIVSTDCGLMRLGVDCGREGKLFRPRGERN